MATIRFGTIEKTAKEFGFSAYFIRGLCKSGKLPHFKSGNKTLIDWDVFEEYIRNLSIPNEKFSDNNNRFRIRKQIE